VYLSSGLPDSEWLASDCDGKVAFQPYPSRINKRFSIDLFTGSWANLLTSSSMLSFILPTLLIILTLCGLLTYYVTRHRRLQQSFTQFANSHYDTRSGSATFCGVDGLAECKLKANWTALSRIISSSFIIYKTSIFLIIPVSSLTPCTISPLWGLGVGATLPKGWVKLIRIYESL
jgi:hypothetical protein